MTTEFKVPTIKKAKPKVSYGISRTNGITSKNIGIMTPLGGSYRINKDPFSTTYKAEGTTKRSVTISASVTKPTFGESYYGLQFSKKTK
jgi:hypothetical protein